MAVVTSTLTGYVDLTLAEAEAFSVAIGVPHLPWLVPPRPADPNGDRVAEGRDALLARGLARRSGAGYAVDANLAAAMRLCARSGHLLSVFGAAVHEGEARVTMSWLCVGDEHSVAITAHPDRGVFRIRAVPSAGTLRALMRLIGPLEELSPAPRGWSISREQLQRLEGLLEVTGNQPLDPALLARAGVDTESLNAVLGDLSRAVVVSSLTGSPEVVTSQAFSWFVTRGDGLLKLLVSADGSLELAPAGGSNATQVLADVLTLVATR